MKKLFVLVNSLLASPRDSMDFDDMLFHLEVHLILETTGGCIQMLLVLPGLLKGLITFLKRVVLILQQSFFLCLLRALIINSCLF